MTTVKFNFEGGIMKLEIKGHSGYAMNGYDIVCCAISTLAQFVLFIEQKEERARNIKIKDKEGYLYFETEICQQNTVILETLQDTLLELETQYKSYLEVLLAYE